MVPLYVLTCAAFLFFYVLTVAEARRRIDAAESTRDASWKIAQGERAKRLEAETRARELEQALTELKRESP